MTAADPAAAAASPADSSTDLPNDLSTEARADAPAESLARRSRRRWIAVAVATAGFTVALLTKETWNVWLVTGLAAAVSLALAAWSDGRRLLAVLRPRKRDLAAGLGGGVLLVLATHLLYPLADGLLPAFGRLVTYLYADISAPPGPRAALPLTAFVVLAEEAIWRGVLMEELRNRLRRRRLRMTVATLLYAVPHILAGIPVLILAALAMGGVWTALRMATGRLVAPLLCHLVWSMTIFAIWPLE